MKSSDKVTEAYFGSMGESFAKKTRERIHWICSQVQGDYVLDVGCSQGITEFLLAREGKTVIGIDIDQSAINYAINALENESDSVRKRISFLNISIFDYVTDKLFDTIILAEVLEHISTSDDLLKKISSMLKPEGTLIITVPFGINNYHDHKKTYYLFNLLNEIDGYVKLKDVKFFGKWIGLVTVKAEGECRYSFSELASMLEEAVYSLEQMWLDKIDEQTNLINQLNCRLDKVKEELAEIRSKSAAESVRINIEYEKMREEYEKLKLDYEKMVKKNQECFELNEKYKMVIESKNNALLERLESEEKTLEEYKATVLRFNHLEAKYAHICKKYELLSKSKLGRLTLNYWKYRKRIPKDF